MYKNYKCYSDNKAKIPQYTHNGYKKKKYSNNQQKFGFLYFLLNIGAWLSSCFGLGPNV